MDKRLAGKSIIVTGSSRGIGRACAMRCAEAGARVAVHGRTDSSALHDTLAAIDKYGVRDGISYISTGGGAFLEFVEGKKLPAVAMLEKRAASGA